MTTPHPHTHHTNPVNQWGRRARWSLTAGVILTALGLATLIGTIAARAHEGPAVVSELARLAVVCGVVMGGISLLALKGRSIEEAYRLGYDVGYETGFRTGLDVAEEDPHAATSARREHYAVAENNGKD